MTLQPSPSAPPSTGSLPPRPVRVCALITELGIGGAQKVMADVLTHLPQDRYRVLAVCIYNPGETGEALRRAGIQVVDLAMRSKTDITVAGRLLRLLRSFRPDILHTHMFHANLLGRLVGRLAGVPLVISTEHTMGQEGSVRRVLNRWTSPLAGRVVAVSQSVGDFAVERIRIDPGRVVVIPNGIDLRRYQTGPDPREARAKLGLPVEGPVVGSVGTLRPVKGFDILLQAFARLAPHWPGAHLLIVGDGPEMKKLRALADILGLCDRVHFTGARTDVEQLLPALDVFVCPSHWEGLPLAVVEAMAAGLPVVATRVSSLTEVVAEGVTGLIVPPADPAALAHSLETLLEDPELRRRMGAAGRQRAQDHYTLERMVSQTEELYQALLQTLA